MRLRESRSGVLEEAHMNKEREAEIAAGISLSSLRELHENLRSIAARGKVEPDVELQARIFEAELKKRGETFDVIRFA